ncbi:MAG: hypothetical protein JW888_02020 [Pirellulales bacterium]|nr:hypothetical protein [Pirellulales bacterium]
MIGLVVTVGCDGCSDRSTNDRPLPTIVASGDTAGWIVPCGCASNQSGGLPRRASCVKRLIASGDVLLLVDVGGAPVGTSSYDRLKFEAIAKGEVIMGIAAHNIGAGEVALGTDCLRDAAGRLKLPLVSANTRDRQGRRLSEPLRMIDVADHCVAVIGVLDPRYATDRIEVTSPHQAVLDTIATIRGPCDAVVVLAYLPEDALRRFAETLPEVDLIIGGPTGQTIPPTRLGPTLLASATNQGKFLAVFSPGGTERDGKFVGRIVELDESFEDDSAQVDNIKQFYELLAQHDFRPEQTSFVSPLPEGLPRGFAVAGSKRCAECHEEEYGVWHDSKHRRAWDSLKNKGAHVDPDCQRCHVTGYGMPDGFHSLAQGDMRINVGCESCHGPSQAHCDNETVHTTHYDGAKNHCQTCHDRENSPEFSYDTYWPKIRHGDQQDEPAPADPTGEKSS